MTLELYRPGTTPLHRLPAGAKLLGLLLAGVATFRLGQPGPLLLALAGSLSLYGLGRVPPGVVLRHLRPVLPLAVAVFGAHALVTGWQAGLIVVLRLAVLVLLATLITLTTRVSEMVELIERLCAPLRVVGVNPRKVGLVLALSLRLLPLLAEKAEEVRDAQRARGAERHLLAMLVPLLIKSLALAHDLGDALEARGFEDD